MSKELTTSTVPLKDMQTMALAIAKSGMFGVKTEDEALSLMLLCQAEGLHPALAVRRYHIVDGKPSMRADAMQGEFEQRGGAILFHVRDDAECSATFFRHRKAMDGPAIARAKQRYAAMKKGDDPSELAEADEITIIRTLEDAIAKKIALSWNSDKREWIKKKNWQQSPRQMLHARCVTEGIRAIDPGLIAGIYTEDEIQDMGQPELDQRPPEDRAATSEKLVRQAIENREAAGEQTMKVTATLNGQPIEAELVEDEIPGIEHPPREEATPKDWREVECHIGKANGKLLGFKLGEMDKERIKYLVERFADPLLANETKIMAAPKKDVQLAQAVKAAWHEMNSEASPENAQPQAQEAAVAPIKPSEGEDSAPEIFDWRIVTVPFECKVKDEPLEKMSEGHLRALHKTFCVPMDMNAATPEHKKFKAAVEMAMEFTGAGLNEEQLRDALRDFAENNVMTEAQFMKLVHDEVIDLGDNLAAVTEGSLRHLYQLRPELKTLIDDKLKPKAVEKPKRTRKTK